MPRSTQFSTYVYPSLSISNVSYEDDCVPRTLPILLRFYGFAPNWRNTHTPAVERRVPWGATTMTRITIPSTHRMTTITGKMGSPKHTDLSSYPHILCNALPTKLNLFTATIQPSSPIFTTRDSRVHFCDCSIVFYIFSCLGWSKTSCFALLNRLAYSQIVITYFSLLRSHWLRNLGH